MSGLKSENFHGRTDTQIGELLLRLGKARPLLVPELEQNRLDSQVRDSLTIKNRPDYDQYVKFKPLDQRNDDPHALFLELAKPFILRELTINEEEQILLMDKLQPHALHELMIISSGKQTRSGIADHSRETRNVIFHLMRSFPQFAKIRQLHPYIAFSYDPETFDRESAQSEKRFHAHLIGRTVEELDNIRTYQKPLAHIDHMRRRRLIDETSVVASHILYDYLSTYHTPSSVRLIKPFTEGNCPNLVFELIDNWDTLLTDSFDHDFVSIHQSLHTMYNTLINLTCDGSHGYWQRSTMKNREQIATTFEDLQWMSEPTIEALSHMISQMRPYLSEHSLETLRNPSFRDIATHVVPMAGLSYSTAFYEDSGKAYGVIRPQLFSDLGGAGVEFIEKTTTKFKRGVGQFTENDMKERQQFQLEFLNQMYV